MAFGRGEPRQKSINNIPALNRFYESPLDYPPEQSEDLHELNARTTAAWHKTIADYRGQHILIITHAGVIRMLFTLILSISWKKICHLKIGFDCLTRFQCFHSDSADFTQLVSHS